MRVACLIDGEHYLPNLRETLESLSRDYEIAVAVFIGGTEKIGSDDEVRRALPYPVEFAHDESGPAPEAIAEIAEEYGVEAALDLSDEPIVDYRVRFRIANELLYREIAYHGADFEFKPMRLKPMLSKPSLAIWGTGKRIGKTAIGGYVARTLKKHGYRPGVVTLSRGGPSEPEVLRGDEVEVSAEFLLEMSEKGYHAASDNFEDALTGRVITFGCKRCGGGLAGRPYTTIVEEGARMANEHGGVDTVVLEGSGATFPEIKTDRVILLVGAGQPLEYVKGYFGPYRVKHADLVIIAMCEEPIATEEHVEKVYQDVKEINPTAPVVKTVFRPKPLSSIKDKNVFFTTTAPQSVVGRLAEYLEDEYDCRVVGTSTYLSNRPKLREDLGELEDVDLVLTELKAASVDVVVREALKYGKEVAFCDNSPVIVGGDSSALDKEILKLVEGI